jgi:hypothetical protein
MEVLGDNEKNEKEIDRITLEYKLKQPQTLFNIWTRKIEIDSTAKIDDTYTSPVSSSSLSNKLCKYSKVNCFS